MIYKVDVEADDVQLVENLAEGCGRMYESDAEKVLTSLAQTLYDENYSNYKDFEWWLVKYGKWYYITAMVCTENEAYATAIADSASEHGIDCVMTYMDGKVTAAMALFEIDYTATYVCEVLYYMQRRMKHMQRVMKGENENG